MSVASRLAGSLWRWKTDFNIEIHLMGNRENQGDHQRSSGMVTGSGFDARIKPDSYGASKVADKFTK